MPWERPGPRSGPGPWPGGAWLHYGLGLSFAKCAKVLGGLGIDVTAGAICSSSASTGTDLVPTHDAILAHVASAPAVTMDETGVRHEGARIERLRRREDRLMTVT